MHAAGDSWTFEESGPIGAGRVALLLPGMFCTGAFYSGILADERWDREGIRLIAATPAGFGRNPLPDGFDPTVEAYAAALARVAADRGATLIVGHSYFGNVAVEAAAAESIDSRLVLLSPCFSRADEEKDVRQLDKICRVPGVGAVAMALIARTIPGSVKDRLSARPELTAEMKVHSSRNARHLVNSYFDHLDRHGSLVGRLCDSGAQATVVRGAEDEVGLSEENRAGLEECPRTRLVTVPDCRHFVMLDQPGAVAELISELA